MKVIRHEDPHAFRAFGEEAVPRDIYDEARARKNLTRRLAGEGGHGIHAKVDYRVVCDAALITSETPSTD